MLMPAPPTGLANQYVWYDANGNLGLTPLTYSVAITAANLASGFTLTSDQITVGTQTLTAYITNLALSISALGNNVSALAPNINTTTTLNGNVKVNASALYQGTLVTLPMDPSQ